MTEFALAADELDRLSSISTDVTYSQGGTLFSEQEPAAHLFTLTSGWIKLYKLMPDGRRQITGFLAAGDVMGIAAGASHAYAAEAITATTACHFPRRALTGLLQTYPHLQQRLFAEAANELVAAQEQMLLLGRTNAKEKLCSFFLNLAKRRGGDAAHPLPP